MGKTSAAVKNRYNAKTYDRVEFILEKGGKQRLKDKAESLGYSSVSSFIAAAVNDFNKKAEER